MASASFVITAGRGFNLPEVISIIGSIKTNGSSPSVVTGKGFTVSQVGTGLYRITFNKVVPRIITVLAQLLKASASDTQVEVVDQDPANLYVTFRVVKTSDGTAVAPGSVNDQINFVVHGMAAKLAQV